MNRAPAQAPRDASAAAIRQVTAPKDGVTRVSDSLRTRVIDLLTHSRGELAHLPISDIRTLVHELDTHQVELEQQNEELRLAQLALAESCDRLSDLYEFAPVGYLTLDALGLIRESNLAAAELLGLSRQKLLGKRYSAFVATEDGDAFHLYFQKALVSERKTSCELAMRKTDPGHGPLRLRLESTRMHAARSEQVSCHVALIDITQSSLDRATLHNTNRDLEQAVAERTAELSGSLARLRNNEDRLALALDAGGMGTWTIDLVRRHAWCDERHERLYARTPNADGHPLDEWLAAMHPDDRERMQAAMQLAIQGVDPMLAAEYRIQWPDGSTHWLAVRGRVIFDHNAKPSHIVGVEQNIDERKTLEMELLHVADAEQRRIGQELHDDIQQRLTGLGQMAESLCEVLSPKSGRKAAPEHGMCNRLTLEIGETAVRVKRLSHGLVPLELEGDGLGVALHRLAHATDAPGRLNCVFKQEEAIEVRDGFVATHLYRIAQEAVTNAVHHSGASRITISLSRDAGRAVMTVGDNGNGGQPRSGEGRGLRIMAYRASLIGATLKIARTRSKGPAKGTQVSCAFTAGGRTHDR